ncbi:hypothetical protein Q673_11175 [Marinobacter sp. EN3]|uniref:hypothetical protein n=1 Tax=Marinobacter sp. EN3 TaxID=1397533 RepID=UPI0003B8397C|nr:hypothetical protein [Marinobacter sp. EN3]ERS11289.1 hypothetical protein Q673_11175 [Marinobacter sp. EN3]
MSYFFVGAFSDPNLPEFRGSAAGAKVQLEIIDALETKFGKGECFIMPEVPSWPRGRLFVPPSVDGKVRYLPIINLFFLKKPFFFMLLFLYFARFRPSLTFHYNASISGQIFSLLSRAFSSKSVLILQDVHCDPGFSFPVLFNPKRFLGFIDSKLLPVSFDFYVPITESCVFDFDLPATRCHVFSGAVLTTYLQESQRYLRMPLEDFSVFAGALEEYNGVDILVKSWPSPGILEHRLHIFGGGSLEPLVREMAIKNNNIVFYGFSPPELVRDHASRASFNFCLRYSRGLNQSYFFPSKFFDLICFNGILVCNRFLNIPEGFDPYLEYIDEELEGLIDILKSDPVKSDHACDSKFEFLAENHTWVGLFDFISVKFNL